jgi:hypothetical protein
VPDLLKATSINPHDANAWYNMSVAQKNLGQFKQAFNSAKKSHDEGYNIAPAYLNDLELKSKL